MRPERKFLYELALLLHKPVRELEETMSIPDLIEWGTFLRIKQEEEEAPPVDFESMSPDQVAAMFGAKVA
jgi:hypothetical protein